MRSFAAGQNHDGGESACRPGSVRPLNAGRRSSIWDCRCRQPRAVYPRASGGPPSIARAGNSVPLLTLLRVGFTEPPQSPAALVVSYTTVSPLPPRWRGGGLFSVALSRGSPRVGVTDHLALWSPDLPHRACARRDRPADSPTAEDTPVFHAERTAVLACGIRLGPGGIQAPGAERPIVTRAGRPQQAGFGRIGPANAPRVVGPTLPYCLSRPNVAPLRMLPNSHTHEWPTLASVQYG
jgi:hypothetical protein